MIRNNVLLINNGIFFLSFLVLFPRPLLKKSPNQLPNVLSFFLKYSLTYLKHCPHHIHYSIPKEPQLFYANSIQEFYCFLSCIFLTTLNISSMSICIESIPHYFIQINTQINKICTLCLYPNNQICELFSVFKNTKCNSLTNKIIISPAYVLIATIQKYQILLISLNHK